MDLASASRRLDGVAVTGVDGVATVAVAGGVLRIIKAVDPTLNSSQSVSLAETINHLGGWRSWSPIHWYTMLYGRRRLS